jgi:hypothetical protein
MVAVLQDLFHAFRRPHRPQGEDSNHALVTCQSILLDPLLIVEGELSLYATTSMDSTVVASATFAMR